MKLHTRTPDNRRPKAREVIGQVEAETNFSLTKYLLTRPEFHRVDFAKLTTYLVEQTPNPFESLLTVALDYRTLEHFLRRPLLSKEVWAKTMRAFEKKGEALIRTFGVLEADLPRNNHALMHLQYLFELHQLFPDNPCFQPTDEQFARIERVVRGRIHLRGAASSAVDLITMRPKRRHEFVTLVDNSMKPTTHSNWHKVNMYRLANGLLVHPEWRQIFQKSNYPLAEIVQSELADCRGRQFFQRAAALALLASPNACIDDRGQIQIEPEPSKISTASVLPERPM